MSDNDKYWFPAKRHGFGWGAPTGWQGWLVLAVFFILIGIGMALRPQLGEQGFLLGVIALSCALFGVCWLKGEPARWRWGDRE